MKSKLVSYLTQRIPRALIIALGVAVLGVIAGTAFSVASAFKHRELAKAEEAGFVRSQNHAAIAEQLILRILDEVAAYLRLVHRWSEIPSAGDESTDVRLGQFMLDELARRSNPVAGAFILTSDGRLVTGTSQRDDTPEAFTRAVSEAVSSGLHLYVTLLHSETIQQEARVGLVVRQQHADGSFSGHGIGIVRPLALSAALRHLSTQDAGALAIVRREGELIARHDAAEHWIGHAVLTEPLRERSATQQRGTLRSISPITGRDHLAAWRRIPDTNLIVFASVDAERNNAAAVKVGRMAHVMALATVATSALVFAIVLAWIWRTGERTGRREIERLHVGLPAVIFAGHVEVDGSFRRLYRSGDVERVTGWSPEQLADRPLHELHNGVGEAFESYIRRAWKDGYSVAEWGFRLPDGGSRTLRTHVRLMEKYSDGRGAIVGYVLDVSPEKSAQLQALASARMASVGEMATGLAHELNQPLAVITLAAQNMRRAIERRGPAAIADVLQRIGRIEANAMRARDLIEHLRLFARARCVST